MKITTTQTPKVKPDTATLGFGKYFTDHMLTADYTAGKGWHDLQILPFENFSMSPATTVLHYGQGVFEGLKAYINTAGGINLFRPKDNLNRMNHSNERLCMPDIPVEEFYQGLIELIRLEKDWIPTEQGTALYIRPTMVSTGEFLGVAASPKYKFFIILSPVGSYYSGGLRPTRIYVEKFYVRASIGGTGEAKCLGNYAASMKGGAIAKNLGYDQVLWLDAVDKKYVEEVGAMNIFFVINGEVITPPLGGSILAGITRDSVIKLLKKKGIKVTEQKISIQEVIEAQKAGTLTEAFGSGTAAVISPVGLLHFDGTDYEINGGKMGEVSLMLYDTLTGIQTGRYPDDFGWVVTL